MAGGLFPLAGCASSACWVREADRAPVQAALEASDVDARVILIGDAGDPRLGAPEPVFTALAADAGRFPDRTWVVFLGDNIYPHGLPPAGHADHALALQRLRAAIDAVAPTRAEIVFIPGNHDYAFDGWAGVERERAWIAALGNPRVRALPSDGCPGPESVDVASRVRLVFLDTQWWFQDGSKPLHPDSPCPADSPAEILAALGDALGGAGNRSVLVLGHHPLATHGGHGGFFTWRQHLFPLTEARRWAWVPLPILGSLYPVSRQLGITEQDLSSATYQQFINGLGSVLRSHPVLLYGSGHEHNLQVLDVPGTSAHVVSGAGTLARPEPAGHGEDTLFAGDRAGYVIVDVRRDGSARLEVVQVEERGVRRPFVADLER